MVGGKLLVEDMRSLNGTFVDDRRWLSAARSRSPTDSLCGLVRCWTIEVRLFKTGAALLRRVDDPAAVSRPPGGVEGRSRSAIS